MKKTAEKIKNYWEEKALRCGNSPNSSLPDYNLRELEIFFIKKNLKPSDVCLDIGCGNGFSTYRFAKKVKKIIGVDYSKNMIRSAKNLYKRNNLEFRQMDILNLKFKKNSFDKIITERCLINLTSWKDQQKAILNIQKLLVPEGKYIMCESFRNCFNKFNKLRGKFRLDAIKKHWHSVLLNEKTLIAFLEKYFQIENIYGMGYYYFISRIIHPLLVWPKEPQYQHPINKIAVKLSKKMQNEELNKFSTNKVIILKKK